MQLLLQLELSLLSTLPIGEAQLGNQGTGRLGRYLKPPDPRKNRQKIQTSCIYNQCFSYPNTSKCCNNGVWALLSHSLNHWTWDKDWVSHGSTGEGNSAAWPEGVEPGCTSPRSHLRADCHWERLFLEIASFGVCLFVCKPRIWVNIFIYFWLFLSDVIVFLAVWSVGTSLTTPLYIFVNYTVTKRNSCPRFLQESWTS